MCVPTHGNVSTPRLVRVMRCLLWSLIQVFTDLGDESDRAVLWESVANVACGLVRCVGEVSILLCLCAELGCLHVGVHVYDV